MIEFISVSAGFFLLGFLLGTYTADRFWEPLFLEVVNKYEGVILRRIEKKLNKEEPGE